MTTPHAGTVLGGVRVVDCSDGIAGPVAAMLLADFGADVVKVEPPGGCHGRTAPGFAVWNRGKRSVVADLGTAAGRSRVTALLAGADVCVANSTLDELRGTPLDPDASRSANPGLVYLHMPPYTASAPWSGAGESDPLLAATTGVALRQASFDGGPVDAVYPHLVTVQGLWAAAAVVAALVERGHSGSGQTVTVAGIHGVMVAAAGALTFDPSAAEPERPRPGGPGGSVPFYRTYRCQDGEWLFLAALTPRFTERAFATLGLGDLLDDERLDGKGRAAILRPEHVRWAIDRIAAAFLTRPRDEWLARLADAGCPAGPLLSRDEWLDHPQLSAIGMRVAVDDPERGRVVMPGVPLQLSATPGAVAGPAPSLGQHDEAAPWPATTTPAQHGRARNGPLEGVRVLDLGAIIAGPFAASLLAELGADVVKVEPLTGDSFRGPGFAAYNKGQRGVALDLHDGGARRAFLELVRTADVVLDNYRPGVLGRLGLRYEDLREVNDRVITVSITGFGDGGPLGQEAGFDPVLQAMSGMMTAQGGNSDPVFFTVPVDDVAASATAALGACLAVLHRDRTGRGQRVCTSLAAMSALLQAGELVRWAGRPPAPVGGRDHPGPTGLDRYHRVADGWVRARPASPDDGLGELIGTLAGLRRDDAVERLTRAGVPAAPARRATELAEDQEVLDYGVLHPDPRPGREGWWTAGRHARFSRTERTGTLVSPGLGEHTRDVLEEAGLAPAEVDALLAAGVAAEERAARPAATP